MDVSECRACGRMFRDDPDTAGVCPCGHENHYVEDELDHIPARGVTL